VPCVFPWTYINIWTPLGFSISIPIPDVVKLPGYLFCVVADFLAQLITAFVNLVVGTLTVLGQGVATVLVTVANAIVAFLDAITTAFQNGLMFLGIAAPVAQMLGIVIVAALGLVLTIFGLFVAERLYELL
jgi:hypothetical protein